MARRRITLRFPFSLGDLAEALHLHDTTGAEVVVRPRERRACRELILPPPPDRPYVLRSVAPAPVRALSVAPSLPTVRPPRRRPA